MFKGVLDATLEHALIIETISGEGVHSRVALEN